MARRRTFVVSAAHAGRPLQALLASELSLESSEALVRVGAVYVQGRRCQDPARTMRAGERVLAMLSEGGVSALSALNAGHEPRVLYEDADLIALDKPAGCVTQPSATRVGDSLLDWAQRTFGDSVGLVHRLDRETSGVVVFGRHAVQTSALSAHFREGRARKRYLALVGPGAPEAGVIDLPLSRDPSRPGRYRATKTAHGVPARTRFRRAFADADASGMELWPETGRTHQLRAHLTSVGFPIAGDTRYGGPRELGGRRVPRVLLHAAELLIPHPTRSEMLALRAPLPEDMAAFWRADKVVSDVR